MSRKLRIALTVLLCVCMTLGIAVTAQAAALRITRQPKNVTVVKGAEAKVTVTARGDGLTYQWWYANEGVNTFRKDKTATTQTYKINMAAKYDGRRVYCVIKDEHGASVQTETVTLGMYPEVKITTQPKDVTVVKGANAQVTVAATGDGLKYEWWYKNAGASAFRKSTVTTRKYTVSMTATRDGQQVYCIVKDSHGQSVQSRTVTLSMAPMPRITRQPSGSTTVKGSMATATVAARGEGLKYEWWYKNADAEAFVKSTIKTAAYSVKMTAARAGQQVYCVVTDQYGQSVQSRTVTLKMAPIPRITRQPKDQTVVPGREFTLTVTASGKGLTYQWFVRYPGDENVYEMADVREYTMPFYSELDGAEFYCDIVDQYGQTLRTRTATLRAAPPIEIVTQPGDTGALAGQTVNVVVEATGEGLKYRWWIKVPGAEEFTRTSKTNKNYAVTMTSKVDGRQVYCVITDKYGQEVTTETVTLHRFMPISVAVPELEWDLSAETVSQGYGTGRFSTTVTSEDDDLSFSWWIRPAGETEYIQLACSDTQGGNLRAQLDENDQWMAMAKPLNGTEWIAFDSMYCAVRGSYGYTVQSEPAAIDMPGKLKIVRQPENVSVLVGETATVSVEVSGGRDVRYQWRYYTVWDYTEQNGSTTDSFSAVPFADEFDSEDYCAYCIITDAYGQQVTSDTAKLWAFMPLSIYGDLNSVYLGSEGESIELLFLTDGGSGPVPTCWYAAMPGETDFTLFYESEPWENGCYVTLSQANSGMRIYAERSDPRANTVRSRTAEVWMGPAGFVVEAANGEITIVDYVGTDKEITIPATIAGLPVTAVAEEAFADCTFTKVTVDAEITSWGRAAFTRCTKLTRVVFNAPTTAYSDEMFKGCYNITGHSMPEGVVSIGKNAFSGCYYLRSVELPTTLERIGSGAFSTCTYLTSAWLPENVEYVGSSAYSGCTSLSSVSLPASLKEISDHTFSGCSALTSIRVPEGVERIGSYAFSNTTKLASVRLPVSLTFIDPDAFAGLHDDDLTFYLSTADCYACTWCGESGFFFQVDY